MDLFYMEPELFGTVDASCFDGSKIIRALSSERKHDQLTPDTAGVATQTTYPEILHKTKHDFSSGKIKADDILKVAECPVNRHAPFALAPLPHPTTRLRPFTQCTSDEQQRKYRKIVANATCLRMMYVPEDMHSGLDMLSMYPMRP